MNIKFQESAPVEIKPVEVPAPDPEKPDGDKPAAPEPEPTAEELQKRAEEISSSLFFAPPKEKKAKEKKADLMDADKPATTTEPPKPDDDKTKAAATPAPDPVPSAAPAPPAEPESPKPKVRPKKPAVQDQDELAESVARKVTEAMRPTQAPPATVPADAQLTAEETKKIQIFRVMEEQDAKHSGLAAKAEAFYKQQAKFISDWKAKHGGKEFDEDAPEYVAFLEKNDPVDWDDDFDSDYNESRAVVATRREVEKGHERLRAEQQKAAAARDANARVEAEPVKALNELVAAVIPDAKDFDGDFAKLEELDPLAADVVERHGTRLRTEIVEFEKLFTPGLGYTPSADNPVHVKVLNDIYTIESGLLAMPEADQMWGGRKLASVEDFQQMTPAQQAKHWTIWGHTDMLRKILVHNATAQTKQEVEKIHKRAEAFATKRAGGKAPNGTPVPPAAPAAKPASASQKPAPPSAVAGNDKVTSAAGTGSTATQMVDLIASSLFE